MSNKEELELLAMENKNFSKHLESVGYSQEAISNVANGCKGKMKHSIRRWETHSINILVQYEVEADSVVDAKKRLSEEPYSFEGRTVHWNTADLMEAPLNGKPLDIDEEDWWKTLKDGVYRHDD